MERTLRKAVEEKLRGVLLAESSPSGGEELSSFWKRVAESLNEVFSAIGYGKPIDEVFVDLDDGDAFVVFRNSGSGLSVVIVISVPLLEEDYGIVVEKACEVFLEMKDLIDHYSPVYCVRMPCDVKCSCGYGTEFFYFRAPTSEFAESVIEEIRDLDPNELEEKLETLGFSCGICFADSQVRRTFEL